MMPQVLIVMGSKSDAEICKKAQAILQKFDVTSSMHVASAHRTPERVKKLVTESDADVFIAVAGLVRGTPWRGGIHHHKTGHRSSGQWRRELRFHTIDSADAPRHPSGSGRSGPRR